MKIYIDGIEYDLVPKSSPDKNNERDWEIECFTDGKRNWWLQSNGFYTHQIFDTGLTASQLISDKKIWAVRRKSDKVVFSVGGNVEFRSSDWDNDCWWGGKINRIELSKTSGELLFILDDDEEGTIITKFIENIRLSKLPERTKLFTTEDGVDIRNEDNVWFCDIYKWNVNIICNLRDYAKRCDYTYFSSKEKAEEYLLMNKPTLSVNDILALWCIENPARKELIELAKSKL